MDRWKLSLDRSTLTITRQVVDRSGTSEEVLVYHREGELSLRPAPATAISTPESAAPKPFSTPEALEAALAGPAVTPVDADLIVHAGTHIGLSLRNPVDTKHSHEGDHIYLQTIAPIAVDNRIVIPQGSFVNGTITQSKSAHGVKGKGELYIRFDSLTLPNGVTRDFRSRLASADSTARGQVDKKEGKITGERDSTGDAQTVALGTGIGASVGGIAGAAAGHTLGGVGIGAAAGAAAGLGSVFHSKRPDAVLSPGTTLEMVLDRDLQFKSSELPF
jgi:type IV secretion system protein VirB10